ncbi:type VI secretion system baseplate subunit TssF [Xenorhabdus sp. BG5]|uniref:type VI secretion system baseplate subunit TssF n=1 Tax=Xenorhabdus sp. BG5 TaxID=2782014 RepID=UPI00187E6C82|nr:type VI secretion system baseplate subunit TssF [Xenorhabdus sp. BG5]MBE8596632.1 type VI secretion system baseplate subunit TssF [Xenorhabdus sp. BG5]
MKNNKGLLYLKERAYLRDLAEHIAKESPHLAEFLLSSHDPDIVRVFEAFAFLVANLRDKLEDNPELALKLDEPEGQLRNSIVAWLKQSKDEKRNLGKLTAEHFIADTQDAALKESIHG